VPRIRAAARVTEAIRVAQGKGIDWQGALDDFLAAVSGAAR
jgi:shikimate kinase